MQQKLLSRRQSGHIEPSAVLTSYLTSAHKVSTTGEPDRQTGFTPTKVDTSDISTNVRKLHQMAYSEEQINRRQSDVNRQSNQQIQSAWAHEGVSPEGSSAINHSHHLPFYNGMCSLKKPKPSIANNQHFPEDFFATGPKSSANVRQLRREKKQQKKRLFMSPDQTQVDEDEFRAYNKARHSSQHERAEAAVNNKYYCMTNPKRHSDAYNKATYSSHLPSPMRVETCDADDLDREDVHQSESLKNIFAADIAVGKLRIPRADVQNSLTPPSNQLHEFNGFDDLASGGATINSAENLAVMHCPGYTPTNMSRATNYAKKHSQQHSHGDHVLPVLNVRQNSTAQHQARPDHRLTKTTAKKLNFNNEELDRKVESQQQDTRQLGAKVSQALGKDGSRQSSRNNSNHNQGAGYIWSLEEARGNAVPYQSINLKPNQRHCQMILSSKTNDVVKPLVSHRRQLSRPTPFPGTSGIHLDDNKRLSKVNFAPSNDNSSAQTTPNSGIRLPKIPQAPHESLLSASSSHKASDLTPSQVTYMASPVSQTEKKEIPQHKFRSFDDKPVSFLEKLKKSQALRGSMIQKPKPLQTYSLHKRTATQAHDTSAEYIISSGDHTSPAESSNAHVDKYINVQVPTFNHTEASKSAVKSARMKQAQRYRHKKSQSTMLNSAAIFNSMPTAQGGQAQGEVPDFCGRNNSAIDQLNSLTFYKDGAQQQIGSAVRAGVAEQADSNGTFTPEKKNCSPGGFESTQSLHVEIETPCFKEPTSATRILAAGQRDTNGSSLLDSYTRNIGGSSSSFTDQQAKKTACFRLYQSSSKLPDSSEVLVEDPITESLDTDTTSYLMHNLGGGSAAQATPREENSMGSQLPKNAIDAFFDPAHSADSVPLMPAN